MRAIRALFNKAIERGVIKESLYPFKTYKISNLRDKGFKRALDFEEIMRIINLDLSDHPHLINCKNYFVFSFYTRGMNFADMMCLEWKDVEANVISESLGHQNLAVTQAYLKELDTKIVNKVLEVLL